ncbi:mitochondrial import receptor subunit TOM5 homolog [Selaginella moellendorffii]|uniref:mitochondrial import receptor subunit TOM5 homolog n=1 Tax=Selaginella moellendorffii TaxID=88036 RepID=UPI000D1CBBBB|nr:mitochondrial import receptor subunit TOM5 homolog [Selaginella moellendorffii]XP_024520286.1 mitochondrial import receptor subunit TOM5 homolog [Selaginella moellendorffii]|eukprot:XP_024516294.1 mitochondrial import receptor subunit TOM5 homolog [Selaginella moellendorffii]
MVRIHEDDGGKESKGAIAAAYESASGFVRGVKRRIEFELYDDERSAFNMRLARALGLFGGAIFFMRNFGDVIAI